MNLIKPDSLKKGATIAIISPSGCVEQEKINNAVKYFEQFGYKIKLGKNVFAEHRYMAGNDEQRIEDINWAFSDNSVDAIICSRGGYGCIRLIDKLDYNLIRNNPKIFCGYSDITALSIMFLKKAGLITYSSPMPKGDFQPESLDEFTCNSFWNTLTSSMYSLTPVEKKIYKEGSCSGILWGGNLSTISSLAGIDFIPDDKFIFFAEDVNEPLYKIDRCFRQLINIKDFCNKISGIALGEFTGVEDNSQLDDLFTEIAQELNVPVYGRFPISHSKRKATVPVGMYSYMSDGVITNFV